MKFDMEELVRQHGGLVKTVALRFSRACGEEIDDLIQIGYIGLIKAAERFDESRGLAFSTYAVPVIAGEIRTHLRDSGTIKVSRGLKSDAFVVRRAESDFIAEKGRSPKISELAETTGLPKERVREALQAADAMKNFEEYDKANLWTDSQEVDVTRIDLKMGIASLAPKQRQVIVLRYFRDMTQQQVAGRMGISQVQVCRIEKASLRELCRIMA